MQPHNPNTGNTRVLPQPRTLSQYTVYTAQYIAFDPPSGICGTMLHAHSSADPSKSGLYKSLFDQRPLQVL
eukprot:1959634-Prymnesium_polylepis.2